MTTKISEYIQTTLGFTQAYDLWQSIAPTLPKTLAVEQLHQWFAFVHYELTDKEVKEHE